MLKHTCKHMAICPHPVSECPGCKRGLKGQDKRSSQPAKIMPSLDNKFVLVKR